MSVMEQIEFLYDVGSPNAYLSHKVIPQIEAQNRLRFNYAPVLLGGIFKATNNASPAVMFKDIANKRVYAKIETARFLKLWGVDRHKDNPNFPVNTLQMMRMLTFAQDKPYYASLIECFFHNMWEVPKKMDDPELIEAALRATDLPSDEIIAGMILPETKASLIAATNDAVERGTFGSPTFFYEDEIYFGKEHLRKFTTET